MCQVYLPIFVYIGRLGLITRRSIGRYYRQISLGGIQFSSANCLATVGSSIFSINLFHNIANRLYTPFMADCWCLSSWTARLLNATSTSITSSNESAIVGCSWHLIIYVFTLCRWVHSGWLRRVFGWLRCISGCLWCSFGWLWRIVLQESSLWLTTRLAGMTTQPCSTTPTMWRSKCSIGPYRITQCCSHKPDTTCSLSWALAQIWLANLCYCTTSCLFTYGFSKKPFSVNFGKSSKCR